MEHHWGSHTVDLFATRLNQQLPRFVSWRPDHEAIATDAFQCPLVGENPWCFPRESLIPHLVGLLTRLRKTATPVAPRLPSKPWWPDLVRVMLGKLIILPSSPSTLQAIDTNEFSRIPTLESGYVPDIWCALCSHRRLSSHG